MDYKHSALSRMCRYLLGMLGKHSRLALTKICQQGMMCILVIQGLSHIYRARMGYKGRIPLLNKCQTGIENNL